MAFTTKKSKPAARTKKRSGKHRPQSDQYLKHYWPYLPLLALVTIGFLCNILWPTHMYVLGARSDLSNSSLLAQTNNQRANAHEEALSLNDQLNQAAESKALDMVAGNYWSHTTPDGKTPWNFLANSGYSYDTAGENLAYGMSDAQAAITAWMQSPEHRRNILGDGYTQVGFGIASSKNYIGTGPQTIIVAMYARPATAAAVLGATETDSQPAVDLKNTAANSEAVSRVALLGGATSELPTLLIAVTVAAVVLFVLRHARLLHSSLIRGEAFALHHPYLDALLVIVIVAGILLTRTVGFVL